MFVLTIAPKCFLLSCHLILKSRVVLLRLSASPSQERKEHSETEFSMKRDSSKVTLLSFPGEEHFEQNFGHKAENEKTTPPPGKERHETAKNESTGTQLD